MERNSKSVLSNQEFEEDGTEYARSDVVIKDPIAFKSAEEFYDDEYKNNKDQINEGKSHFVNHEACSSKANGNNIDFNMNGSKYYMKPHKKRNEKSIAKEFIIENSESNQNQKNAIHKIALIPKVANAINKSREKYTKALIPYSKNMNSVSNNAKNKILLQIIKGNDLVIGDSLVHDNENSLDANYSKKSFSQQSDSEFVPSRPSMSREYVALQRSVNESKILTEFVSDAALMHQRKSRNREHHQFLGGNEFISTSQILPIRKKRCYSRLSSTKDVVESSFNTIVRTNLRCNSVHSKFPDNYQCDKIKKWTSEERILYKRSDMRSENSEFVIKQMDFLERVFHSKEVPDLSRNFGRKLPNAVVPMNNPTEQQKKSGITTKDGLINRVSSNISLNSPSQLTKPCSDLSPQNIVESSSEILNSLDTTHNVIHGEGNSSVSCTSHVNDDIIMSRLKIAWQPPPKVGSDSYCWKCHEGGVSHSCSQCIRSFHNTCAKINVSTLAVNWICHECISLDNALNNPKRLRRNKLSMDMLSQLLSIALKHMKCVKGYHNFSMPYEVDSAYLKYIINPVTIAILQQKIDKKMFGSAEEFLNETKWLLHNAHLLSNRNGNKIVLVAKSILTQCRREITEIEACPECYLNANSRNDWFIDVCTQPHLLLWAKLKGFPYWPAKAMGWNQISSVNVRFFGKHDRAFVSVKDCFLYSQQNPNTQTSRKSARELTDCIKEVELHIDKIKNKVGAFQYAPFKTPYDPNDEALQLERMMPGVREYIKRQQNQLGEKPPLQFKIFKTADNHLSIIQKANTPEKVLQENCEQANSIVLKKFLKNIEEKVGDLKQHDDQGEHSTPKYEVICKLTPDDNDTSKLNTVILKRKSSQVGNSKSNSDGKRYSDVIEEKEASLSKLTKNVDKQAEKQKSTCNISTSIYGNFAIGMTNSAEKITVDNINSSKQTILKQKHAAAIKKTRKSASRKQIFKNIDPTSDIVTTNFTIHDIQHSGLKKNTKASLKECVEVDKDDKNRKIPKVLKGLVPFLEIKQEIISDNEDDGNKQFHPHPISLRHSITDCQAQSLDISNVMLSTEHRMLPNSDVSSCTNAAVLTMRITTTTTSTTSTTTATSGQSKQAPLITRVKEELFSENEEQNRTTHLQNNSSLNSDICQQFKHNLTALLNTTNSVHVKGGTTIQRVVNKNSNNFQYNNTQNMSATTINNGTSKRNSQKQTPYGKQSTNAVSIGHSPLSKSIMAKKTLPFNEESSFCSNSNTLSAACMAQSSHDLMQVQPTTLQNLDPLMILHKNTMVTIPADLGSNNISGSLPPLTVVSTCFNTTCAHQSSTSIQSSCCNFKKVQTTTNASISPAIPVINAACATSSAISGCLTTLSSTAINQQNVITNSNAPPPLAGLSGINYISVPFLKTSANTDIPANSDLTPPTATHALDTVVTSSLTPCIKDTIFRRPPKLTVRQNGPLNCDGSTVFPSQAGRFCKKLMENAHKLTDFFISVMEDTMSDMAQNDDLIAKNALLSLELERTTHAHEREITELKRNSDVLLNDMRKRLENEKKRVCNEIRRQCELERIQAIEETKRKQWCAQCGKEANMNCCWNTSYCDYPCQQLHWSRHASTCDQIRTSGSELFNYATGVPNMCAMNITPSSKSNSKDCTNITIGQSVSVQSVPQTEHQHCIKLNSHSNVMNLSKSISGRKESQPNNTNSIVPSPIITTSHSAEVLKLPNNTYLRPVMNANTNVNGTSAIRCNITYNTPVQRFNMAQMPIPTAATTSQQTFTIIQGGNWVMSNNAASNVCNTNNNTKDSIILTPTANVIATVKNVSHDSFQSSSITSTKSLLNQLSPTQIKLN